MGTQCQEHPGDCLIEETEATYGEMTKLTTIHYMSNNILNPLIEETFKNRYPKIRIRFTRGFTKDGKIFIRKNTRIGLNRLIKHEFGHLFGLNHTWKLTLMNRTWIFRWIDSPKISLKNY